MTYVFALLFASLAQAQPAPLPTQSSIPFEDEFKASNNSKDIRGLLKGRYRQTGRPTFAGGFCFADGSCMITTSTYTVAGGTVAPFANYVPYVGAISDVDIGNHNLSSNYGVTVGTLSVNTSATFGASALAVFSNSAGISHNGSGPFYFYNDPGSYYNFYDNLRTALTFNYTGAGFSYGVSAGSFTATSSMTAASANISGNAFIGGAETVTGAMTVGGSIGANGGMTGGNFNLSATSINLSTLGSGDIAMRPAASGGQTLTIAAAGQNVTAAYGVLAGTFTATSSVTAVSGNYSGNVTAGRFYGDGSALTGIVSTSSIINLGNNVAISTLAIQNNVGASTLTLATADFTLGASTKATNSILAQVGVDTKTLQTQDFNIGASTLAIQNNVGASTLTLTNVKASTGTNGTIIAMTAMTTIVSSLTVTDVTNGIKTVSSMTAASYWGDGSHLTGITLSGASVDFSTITTILTAVGVSTKALSASTVTLRTDMFNVGAATLTIQNNVGASTLTLTNVKASTGLNGDIGGMTFMKTITSSLTVTDITNGIKSVSSITASSFWGDASHMTGVTATNVPNTITSSETFTAAVQIASSTLYFAGNSATPIQVGASTFVVTSAGNVGIGTASPCSTCTLHVIGKINATGNIVGNGTFNAFGAAAGSRTTPLKFGTMGLYRNGQSSFEMGTVADANLFDLIAMNGSIAAPTAVSQDAISGEFRGLAYVGSGSGFIEGSEIGLASTGTVTDAANGNGGYIYFKTRTTGANLLERMRIDQAGNVGIGTASPGATLHSVSASTSALFSGWAPITGAGSNQGTIQLGTNASYNGRIYFDGGGSNTDLVLENMYDAATGSAIRFKLRGNNSATSITPMIITSAGNVGIGTIIPGTIVHASSGIVTVDGTSAGINVDQGFVALGGKGVSPLNTGIGLYAKSVDGATQSSGCAVVVYFEDGGGPNQTPLFTSTTTAGISWQTTAKMGVLLESCVPGNFCRVGFGPTGVYRVIVGADLQIAAGDPAITTSGTRCAVRGQSVDNSNSHGVKMSSSAIAINNFAWIRLK